MQSGQERRRHGRNGIKILQPPQDLSETAGTVAILSLSLSLSHRQDNSTQKQSLNHIILFNVTLEPCLPQLKWPNNFRKLFFPHLFVFRSLAFSLLKRFWKLSLNMPEGFTIQASFPPFLFYGITIIKYVLLAVYHSQLQKYQHPSGKQKGNSWRKSETAEKGRLNE